MLKKRRYYMLIVITISIVVIGFMYYKNKEVDDMVIIKGSNNSDKMDVERREELIVGVKELNGIISPYSSDTIGVEYVSSLIYEGLFSNDEKGKAIPKLCEKYEISEDLKSYIIYIKKGIKFSNNIELTSKDIEFTYKILADPNYMGNVPLAIKDIVGFKEYKSNDSDFVRGIEIIDDYTIKFTFNNSWGNVLEILNYGILSKYSMEVKKNEILKLEVLLKNPVGIGPYVLDEINENDKFIVLCRNENYYDGVPNIKKIKIKEEREKESLEDIFNENIDLVTVNPNEHIIDLVKEKKILDCKLINSNEYSYIGLNTKSELLQDKDIRKALLYALDRKRILEEYYNGFGNLITMPFNIESWAYSDEGWVEFDLNKSKELLNQSGFNNKENRKLNILIVDSSYFSEKILEIIKENYEEIGIEIIPEFCKFEDLKSRVFEKKQFDIYVMNWKLPIDPNPIEIFGDSKLNSVSWENQDSIKLLKEIEKCGKYNNKIELYKQWNGIFNDDVPYILIVQPKELVIINSRIIHKRFSSLNPWVYNIKGWDIK